MDMFILVNKGNVVLGPVRWSKKKFETVLEEEFEITTQLPKTMDENIPYVIDKDNTIYSIDRGVDGSYDPRIDILNGPFWTFTDTNAVFHYEPMRMELQAVKNFMLQNLANERWKKENAGCKVTLNGVEYTFRTDRDTRNIFNNALTSTQDTMNWKINVDNWIVLTKSDIQTITNSIMTHVQSCFDWEKQITEQIVTCPAYDLLLNIVIVEPPKQSDRPDIIGVQ